MKFFLLKIFLLFFLFKFFIKFVFLAETYRIVLTSLKSPASFFAAEMKLAKTSLSILYWKEKKKAKGKKFIDFLPEVLKTHPFIFFSSCFPLFFILTALRTIIFFKFFRFKKKFEKIFGKFRQNFGKFLENFGNKSGKWITRWWGIRWNHSANLGKFWSIVYKP